MLYCCRFNILFVDSIMIAFLKNSSKHCTTSLVVRMVHSLLQTSTPCRAWEIKLRETSLNPFAELPTCYVPFDESLSIQALISSNTWSKYWPSIAAVACRR